MTAQPDATREYLRERLSEIARRRLAGKED
jgi:hypothetical protein